MIERTEFKYLGRRLGTCTGWDGDSWEYFTVYDFEPAEGIPLPACASLTIIETSGMFEIADADGNVIGEQIGIVPILAAAPKAMV